MLVLYSVVINAETRYVSKTGSSTPPYTSLETASDSIQKCIDYSNFGDTIYVGKGTYNERLTITKKIHLIGAGADSTKLMYSLLSCVIELWGGSGTIDGFYIENTVEAQYGTILNSALPADTTIIQNCYLVSRASNILVIGGTIIFENNYGKGHSLIVGFGASGTSMLVKNNISYAMDNISTQSIKVTMIDNIIYSEGELLSLVTGGPHLVANNLFISTKNSSGNYHCITGYNYKSNNNLMTGIYFHNAVILCNLANDHRNNMVMNGKYGIRPSDFEPSVIRYNAFWNVQLIFLQPPEDSTNKMLFPMFVDEAGGDFRLQKYSPLIDAGDPELLDVDGTRSDIGPLGGPYGKSYEYLDLAPLPPVASEPVLGGDSLTFLWKKNNETDITGYRVYRDTTENYVPFPDKLIYEGTDTTFTTTMPDSGKNYYYIITAIDSIVNESKPSTVIKLMLTGVEESETGNTIPEKTQLLGNYPNPFNPSTTIRYTINERSYVKLYIYTLRGELLEVRVNEEQTAGEYNYLFSPEITGTIDDLASGVYFYMLETKGSETGKINRDTGKMLLIK